MSFASFQFIFFFLPLTFLVFWRLQRRHVVLALWSLVLASVIFYIAWRPRDILVAAASIAFNFFLARQILDDRARARWWLAFAVAVNLGALAYFKYLNFLAQSFEQLTGSTAPDIGTIILPLGISFFTFTQIAYLVDCHVGKVRPDQHNARDFILFVTFFPHLIAGPILHHASIIPQFHREFREERARKLSAGVVMFVIGLAKKVLIADQLALFANPVFSAARGAAALTSYDAWIGTLAYTGQIYFDFSGYSDMAVGGALLVGIKMPFNFNSPYRSLNIIDFWRRWHMSLSTFLRDYLYIPLGGGRKGNGRRYVNIFITMVLGGVWHGAGLNFVIWGFLHALFITVNHAWRDFFRPKAGRWVESGWFKMLSYIVTMACVILAWVFFRAEGFDAAAVILRAMMGLGAADAAPVQWAANAMPAGVMIAISAALAGWPVNSLRIHDRMMNAELPFHWPLALLACGFVFACSVILIPDDSPFLYFQF